MACFSTDLDSASMWSEAIVVGPGAFPWLEAARVFADAKKNSLRMLVTAMFLNTSETNCTRRCGNGSADSIPTHMALTFNEKLSRQHSSLDCNSRTIASFSAGLLPTKRRPSLQGQVSNRATKRRYKLPTVNSMGAAAIRKQSSLHPRPAPARGFQKS